MIRLMERYGVEIVKKIKNTYYPPKLKLEMIHKVLRNGQSQIQVSLDYALPIKEHFLIGFLNTRKTGILLLRNNEGDRVRWDVNQRKLVKK